MAVYLTEMGMIPREGKATEQRPGSNGATKGDGAEGAHGFRKVSL